MGEEISADGGERPGGRVSPGGWTGASAGFDGMERPGGSGIGAVVGIDAESSEPMALGVACGDDTFEVASAGVPAGTGIETKVDLEGGLSEGIEGLEALGAGIVCSLRSFPRPFDSADALVLVFCRVRGCRPDRITGPGGPSWIVCPEVPAGAAPPEPDVCGVATCWPVSPTRQSVGVWVLHIHRISVRSKEPAIRSPSSDLRTMVALDVVRFSVSLLRCFLHEIYEWGSKRCKS